MSAALRPAVNWGPTGEIVYNRTYSRVKADGSRETWPETVKRVVDGNLGLGDVRHELPGEREDLVRMMTSFEIIPAGRHLWASGVPGRQYLFNCHVSGWDEGSIPSPAGVAFPPLPPNPSGHFAFTFLRLMEGGGVGANYSNKFLIEYPEFSAHHDLHIVCDPDHPDYAKLAAAGVLSSEYSPDWPGAFPVEDSREGWAETLTDLITTFYRNAAHRERVYDISRVRGEGVKLKTFGGRASGPLPLAVMLGEVTEIFNRHESSRLTGLEAMEIDHAIAKCVVSGGNRRSARMSIMHWDDSQIVDFLSCKENSGSHWTTNISVEVDDRFFAEAGMGNTKAALVLSLIAEGMLHNGEPGFWNSSLSNVGEPNEVTCTNPCGEIPLEQFENCNLGHVNLAMFVDEQGETRVADLHRAHELMTRFLIRATNGDVEDAKQREVLARNRRIGVGHLGVASYLAMRGLRYDVAFGSSFARLLPELARTVESAAALYSHALRIPVPVKTRTVAPTGTIAKMPGVSEGIHPIFAKYFVRRIRFSKLDPDQVATMDDYRSRGYLVEDCLYAPETLVVAIPTMDTLMVDVAKLYGVESAERIVQSADEISLEAMLAFQATYQELWADNAVSYTVNVSPDAYSPEHVATMLRAWGPRLKGATVFPDASMPQSPYERLTREQFESYTNTAVADSVDEECASGACPVR